MKKCLIAVSLMLLCALCFQCYYVRQGVALLDVYATAQDIDRLLAENRLPAEERNLLEQVKAIKHFAVVSLGLAENKNYSSYIRLNRNYLASVVSACASLSFKQYVWDYPFVGKLPYKGYMNEEESGREADTLRTEGYDVYVRRVDAFSTLGLLQDPVFSFMRYYPSYALAELILHEQTHATVFLDNQATFNENLASFVGGEGMQRYIKETYGEAGEEYRIALALDHDRNAFTEAMRELYQRLSHLYETTPAPDDRAAEKGRIIDQWKKEFSAGYKEKFRTDLYAKFTEVDINNAMIMTYMNYTEHSGEMRELYDGCGKDLALFVRLAKRLPKNEKNPIAALRKLIDEAALP
jgi:predicted aminopeptidase